MRGTIPRMGSTLLAQQELLTPPPVRSLIVPEGKSAHWGVDVSVYRLAVAAVTSDTKRVRLTPFPFKKFDGPKHLGAIWRETHGFVAALLESGWPAPGLVWVEQPSGANDNLPLSYATGVIQAAIYDALASTVGLVTVETVPSASWKKAATGYGAHYKPTKKKLGRTPVFEDYAVARWAQANGYKGRSWDEADALGVAVAAQRTVALLVR